jgi:hypothetical protein
VAERELPLRARGGIVKRDIQGWTEVNPGAGKSYLNYCRDCGWASAVALWYGDGSGPHCGRCKGSNMGALVPEVDE